MMLLQVIDWIYPKSEIERAPDFPTKDYARNLKQIHLDDKIRKGNTKSIKK